MNVAVVDNDESLLKSLGIILRRQGHDVRCFPGPHEAFEALATGWCPDVIFVDQVMPSVTGLEFLADAAPHLPPACRRAIITGHAEQLNAAELEEAGVDALFPKPLDLQRVREFADRPIARDCA